MTTKSAQYINYNIGWFTFYSLCIYFYSVLQFDILMKVVEATETCRWI